MRPLFRLVFRRLHGVDGKVVQRYAEHVIKIGCVAGNYEANNIGLALGTCIY